MTPTHARALLALVAFLSLSPGVESPSLSRFPSSNPQNLDESFHKGVKRKIKK